MFIMHILGKPIPWKRPAHKLLNGRVIVFDSQKREKEQCRWQMRSYIPSQQLITCPCEVEFVFAFEPPKGVSRIVRRQMLAGMIPHDHKPDIDNCEKFLLDTMNGFIFVDDKQVFKVVKEKIWSECEGTKIIIKPRHTHEDRGPSTILEDLELPPNFLSDETGDFTDADD